MSNVKICLGKTGLERFNEDVDEAVRVVTVAAATSHKLKRGVEICDAEGKIVLIVRDSQEE